MTAEVPEMGASEDAAAPPVEGEGALWAAAHGGDASEVRRLLANGADPNERGDTAAGGSAPLRDEHFGAAPIAEFSDSDEEPS